MRSEAVRSALFLVAAAVAVLALPARAACLRDCGEDDLVGGGSDEPAAADVAQPEAVAHHRPHPIEASLPGYVWTKLRERTHEAIDATAYALIKATASLAVVAAREQQPEPEKAPPPAPARSECDRRKPA